MNVENAKTIAQVKQAPESLLAFLAQLPATMEAQILYGLILGGLIGMAANYVVKWAQGDIAGSLWRYMFVDDPRRSWLAICILLTELIGEVSTGLFTTTTGEFVGWGMVLLNGLKSGYFIDSAANKGGRPVWTSSQRAAAKEPDTLIAPLPITGEKKP